jgi:hypothetical protein
MTTNLNFSKYKRFFAFGCSFTNYKWPTWADIVSQEFTEENSHNYGECGAGNYAIAHSVMEADSFHNLGPDDLVMVMFTNFHREDRYVKSKGGWLYPGNIYSQGIYSPEWMEYFDEDHALMRDLMLIKMLESFLKSKGIDHYFMCMVPFGSTQNGPDESTPEQKELVGRYKDTLDLIKPSIWEVCFNFDWHNVQPRSLTKVPDACHHIHGEGWYEDNHAHPREHLEYIQKLWPDTEFKQSTKDYTEKYHQMVLDKKTPYQENLIQRKQVKRFKS